METIPFLYGLIILGSLTGAAVTNDIVSKSYYKSSDYWNGEFQLHFSHEPDKEIYEYHILSTEAKWKYIFIYFTNYELKGNSTLRVCDGKLSENCPFSSLHRSPVPFFYSRGSQLTLVYKHRQQTTSSTFSIKVTFTSFERSTLQKNFGVLSPLFIPTFCGHIRELSTNKRSIKEGYQMSPPGGITNDRTPFYVNCSWTIKVDTAVGHSYIVVDAPRTFLHRIVYSFTNGTSLHSDITRNRFNGTYSFSTSTNVIITYSGPIKANQYLNFAYSSSIIDAQLLLRNMTLSRRTGIFCPYKRCSKIPGECVWPWSNCKIASTQKAFEPDCDLYFADPDVKSCFPADWDLKDRRGHVTRCYRRSKDACDGYKDCQSGEDENFYCHGDGHNGIPIVKLGIALPITAFALFLCCVLMIKCDQCGRMFDCICGCIDCCKGTAKCCCGTPFKFIRQQLCNNDHSSSDSDSGSQSGSSFRDLTPPTPFLIDRSAIATAPQESLHSNGDDTFGLPSYDDVAAAPTDTRTGLPSYTELNGTNTPYGTHQFTSTDELPSYESIASRTINNLGIQPSAPDDENSHLSSYECVIQRGDEEDTLPSNAAHRFDNKETSNDDDTLHSHTGDDIGHAATVTNMSDPLPSYADVSLSPNETPVEDSDLPSYADVSRSPNETPVEDSDLPSYADAALTINEIPVENSDLPFYGDAALFPSDIQEEESDLSSYADAALSLSDIQVGGSDLPSYADAALSPSDIQEEGSGLPSYADAALFPSDIQEEGSDLPSYADAVITGAYIGQHLGQETPPSYDDLTLFLEH